MSLVVSIVCGMLLSCFIEFSNHRRLGTGSRSLNLHLLSSLGLYIILVQLVIIFWGPNVRSLRSEQDFAFALGGGVMTLTRAQIYALVIQPAVLVAFGLFIGLTNVGLKLRGLMQNPTEMAILGYSTASFRLLAFALSGFFISVASLVNAYDLGYDPRGGLSAIILAIAALIVGGRDTFFGPIVGGLLLGVLRSLAIWFSPKWQDSITFVVLAAFLLFAPTGMLGFRKLLRAK